ncbi:MAG: hypothetical protein ACLSB9_30325 [Hydrogeniiclostridium mannosilyticum]
MDEYRGKRLRYLRRCTPIEGMIESVMDRKVGQLTGSLADALNWVGISEDAFNEKLAACSSESERNRLIMDTLSGI